MHTCYFAFVIGILQIPSTIKKLPKLFEVVGKAVFTELLGCALDDLSGIKVTHERFGALYTETLTEVSFSCVCKRKKAMETEGGVGVEN